MRAYDCVSIYYWTENSRKQQMSISNSRAATVSHHEKDQVL